MKIGIIVLCRYNSSRLPGKILLEIKGQTILKHIINRLRRVFPADNIVVATSVEPPDDIIAKFCIDHKINCFRGSLSNVAERFLTCAIDYNFDFAFRINGDNVFIDLTLIQHVLEQVESSDVSFISNVDKRTFPKGMSIEGVNISLYEDSFPNFSLYEQEHVMPYMYTHAHDYKHLFVYNMDYPELAGVQLAIDTKKDFEQAKYIMNQLDLPERDYSLKDVAQILNKKN